MAKRKTKKSDEGTPINIFKSKMVPDSRIMKEEEKKKLMDKYNVSLDQLPKIALNDPVSKSLEAKSGDIIEFERKTQIAGLSKYYRVVGGGA